jgi:hypothetical protein
MNIFQNHLHNLMIVQPLKTGEDSVLFLPINRDFVVAEDYRNIYRFGGVLVNSQFMAHYSPYNRIRSYKLQIMRLEN